MDKIPENNLPISKMKELANSPTEARADRKPKRERTAVREKRRKKSDAKTEQSHAVRLIHLLQSQHAEFFEYRKMFYCQYKDKNGAMKINPLYSNDFSADMYELMYTTHGTVLNNSGFADAQRTIAAMARGNYRRVYKRVAEHGGAVYIDLCNGKGQFVRCTARGWSIVSSAPVAFVRPSASLPLPVPSRQEKDYGRLRGYMQASTPDEELLIVGFVLACLNDCEGYPILQLISEQGSGKSFLADVVQALVDASDIKRRTASRTAWDTAVAASATRLYVVDNVDYLPNEVSNALCTISTGGSFSRRKLQTDSEEYTIYVRQPSLITSIASSTTQDDVIDRSLIVSLLPIGKAKRRTEIELLSQLRNDMGIIFGGLLDAVCNGLRNKELTWVEKPRLADAAQTVARCFEQGNGEGERFIRAWMDSQSKTVVEQAEENTLVYLVRELLHSGEYNGEIKLPAQELYIKLEAVRGVKYSYQRVSDFPNSAKAMGIQLKQLQGKLKALGIASGKRHTKGGTVWHLYVKNVAIREGLDW